uniref:Integrase catalytic domain-containing protein n=1 Tax=Cacopsylla melanoneura TaxID=428564 RepID=A0A8D9F1P1_9HEMI
MEPEQLKALELELKILNAKKVSLNSFVLNVFGLAKEVPNNDEKSDQFLRKVQRVTEIASEFSALSEKAALLEARTNPAFKVSFAEIENMNDMIGYIKYKEDVLKNKKQSDAAHTAVPLGKASNSGTLVDNQSTIKLQALEIPFFNGNLEDWPVFYEMFKTTVHTRQDLPDSHKLQYLLSKLTGNALTVCAGIPASSENYKIIFDSLVAKFQDKRNLATLYMDSLVNFKPLKQECADHLGRFADVFGSNIAALKALGIQELEEFILFYIAALKLDEGTRRAYENSLAKDVFPTSKSLVAFVQNHGKVLSRVSGSGPKLDQQQQYVKPQRKSHSFVIRNGSCKVCGAGEHPVFKCKKFLNLVPQERYNAVKQHNLCVNCLSAGHTGFKCSSNSSCNVCKNRHNSLLHFGKKETFHDVINPIAEKQACSNPSPGTSHDTKVVVCTYSSPNVGSQEDCTDCTVLLGTVKILVYDIHGKSHVLRFILDSASMSNIISASACKQLGLSPSHVSTVLKGMGSTSNPVQGQVNFKFASRIESRCQYTINALVVNQIVDELPVKTVDISQLHYVKNINLADDEFMVPNKISGILGAQIYPYLVKGEPIFGSSADQPTAVNSTLGYILMGNAPVLKPNSNQPCKQYCMFQYDFDRFWQLDHVEDHISSKLSIEEQKCEQHFTDNVQRDSSGRYVVALPFCEDPSVLGNSYNSAKKRFLTLEGKLDKDPEALIGYQNAMQDLLDKGYMEKCKDQNDLTGYFIPHRAVVKPDSVSTKIRIVYDASAKTTSSKSLNDILHAGPTLYNDLFGILLNFRLFPCAINGDITKMFLQIMVTENDCKYQKLIYRFHKDDPLTTYEMKVVVFGMKPSPFLAQRTVKQLVQDESQNYKHAAQIADFLYMDDAVKSFLTVTEAQLFYKDVVQMFKAGGFNFTKWISNSPEVMNIIPESDQLTNLISFDNASCSVKILGMLWNAYSDMLYFKILEAEKPCTKRGILSAVLTIYDPLGLIGPIVLWVKLLIRQLCLLKVDWDDTPPEQIIQSWLLFKNQLCKLRELQFPRHIGIEIDCIFQLIGFCDASQNGYGAIVYSKVMLSNGDTKVTLVCAKSKVAPLAVQSIPRLELCSLLLLSKLMKVVLSNYSDKFNVSSYYCLTDSSVALCWAHGSPHTWTTFVGNRVAKIQENVLVENVFHIQGTENPADSLSRGQMPSEFVQNDSYFKGPSWLHQDMDRWPTKSYEDYKGVQVPEGKPVVALVSVNNVDNLENNLLCTFVNISSLTKLLKTMVYVLRFTKKLPIRHEITSQDLNFAEFTIVKLVQKCHFKNIFDCIENEIPCPSSVKKLCPFIDSDGLIRVGGRLQNSNLSYSEKHPLLLPSKIHVVKLIVEDMHKSNCHTGPHLLLCLLRQKYWILGARSFVRKITQSCNTCFRNSPKCIYPQMGSLPESRVLESRPFFHTACDFLGPINITMQRKRGARPVKAYVCLFICLAVKAVHLEVVSNLSTEAFLNAFKRFLCRRGPIKSVLSDNGTNFVGAKNQLNEIYTVLESDDYRNCFSSELLKHRIEWTFNPPSSPHFGGIYESNVKSFKTHFYKSVGSQLLTYEEFLTLTVQIESLLNSRPLCTLSSDPSDLSILTPNHFLTMTSLTHIPAEIIGEVPTNRLTRFELLDQMVQGFWRRWSTEYLSQLQVREKWNTPSCPVKIGLVVLIKQENLAPLHWPLGVITTLYPGKDGVVRVVLVKTSRGEFKRPVCKLCPLPTQ